MDQTVITFTEVEGGDSKMSDLTRFGLGVLCLLSLLCGLTMKSIVFWHLSQTKIWAKPINVLILVDELILVTTGSYILLQMSGWLFTQPGTPAVFETLFSIHVNPHSYCAFYISVTSFHYFYATLGSFGISLHRFVLIIKPHWVRGLKKEKVLLVAVLLMCLLTNFGLVVLYNAGNVIRRNAFNSCLGRTETFQVHFSPLKPRSLVKT